MYRSYGSAYNPKAGVGSLALLLLFFSALHSTTDTKGHDITPLYLPISNIFNVTLQAIWTNTSVKRYLEVCNRSILYILYVNAVWTVAWPIETSFANLRSTSASKFIRTQYCKFGLGLWPSGTSIFDSLSSPFPTMIQEEIANKIAALIRIEFKSPFVSICPLWKLILADLSDFLQRRQQKFE